MNKRILLIQGHPDSGKRHFCHALEDAYAEGACAGGHDVRRIAVGELDFPVLRSQEEWEHGSLPPGLIDSQQQIQWAEHIVIFFPLWLGDMPALLKAFLEQVARPGFAFTEKDGNPFGIKGLKGRSARVVATMGMPAAVYRLFYRAHSLRSLERNILGFVGIAPVDETLIGMAGEMDGRAAEKHLRLLEKLGRSAR
jgi:putative NADPH-quinone reductase